MNNVSPNELSQRKPQDAATRRICEEFREAYADCMTQELTDEVWEQVSRVRKLEWKADQPISLADAVKCYGQMATSYNEFKPGVLKSLQKAFPDAGITVTPSREFSVAVYLHIPDAPGLRQEVEAFITRRFRADTIEWEEDGTLHVWWD